MIKAGRKTPDMPIDVDVPPPTEATIEAKARALVGPGRDLFTGDLRSARMMLMDAWKKDQIKAMRTALHEPMNGAELRYIIHLLTYVIMEDVGQ